MRKPPLSRPSYRKLWKYLGGHSWSQFQALTITTSLALALPVSLAGIATFRYILPVHDAGRRIHSMPNAETSSSSVIQTAEPWLLISSHIVRGDRCASRQGQAVTERVWKPRAPEALLGKKKKQTLYGLRLDDSIMANHKLRTMAFL